MQPFKRRVFRNPWEFIHGLWAVLGQPGAVLLLTRGRFVAPALRERLMLVMTAVNECRDCAFGHAQAALASGLSRTEIDDLGSMMFEESPKAEVPALLYAQHFGENIRGDIHWRMANRWRLVVGYRFMDVDYEKASEDILGRRVYIMQHSGPEAAVSFSW